MDSTYLYKIKIFLIKTQAFHSVDIMNFPFTTVEN